jgi:hypothetical protein
VEKQQSAGLGKLDRQLGVERRRDQAAAGRVAAIERQLEAARARAAEQEAFTASLEDVRASTAAALATQARRAKRQQHSATQQLASARRDASLLGALRQFLRHGASDTAQRRAQQLAASVQALPAQLDSLREEVVAVHRHAATIVQRTGRRSLGRVASAFIATEAWRLHRAAALVLTSASIVLSLRDRVVASGGDGSGEVIIGASDSVEVLWARLVAGYEAVVVAAAADGGLYLHNTVELLAGRHAGVEAPQISPAVMMPMPPSSPESVPVLPKLLTGPRLASVVGQTGVGSTGASSSPAPRPASSGARLANNDASPPDQASSKLPQRAPKRKAALSPASCSPSSRSRRSSTIASSKATVSLEMQRQSIPPDEHPNDDSGDVPTHPPSYEGDAGSAASRSPVKTGGAESADAAVVMPEGGDSIAPDSAQDVAPPSSGQSAKRPHEVVGNSPEMASTEPEPKRRATEPLGSNRVCEHPATVHQSPEPTRRATEAAVDTPTSDGAGRSQDDPSPEVRPEPADADSEDGGASTATETAAAATVAAPYTTAATGAAADSATGTAIGSAAQEWPLAQPRGECAHAPYVS